MKKKILIVSILAVFMLVAISFASAASTQKTNDVEKKDSPLFGVRLEKNIGKIEEMKVRSKYIGQGRLLLFNLLLEKLKFSRTISNKLSSVCSTPCTFTVGITCCFVCF